MKLTMANVTHAPPWEKHIPKSRAWLPMVTYMTPTSLERFRPLVASALVAFGLDFRYSVQMAEVSNTLIRKRAELERVRFSPRSSTDKTKPASGIRPAPAYAIPPAPAI